MTVSSSSRPAIPRKVPRQPQPSSEAPASANGPPTTPSEPAKVQRAMFCSRRSGSRSISVACDRLTNAPDAGYMRMNAISSTAKPGAAAVSSKARVNAAPPPTTSALRRQTSPSTARRGSTALLMRPGTLSRTPICA